MQKYILVKADEGISDFVYEFNPITDEEIEQIRPVIMSLFERREILYEDLEANWKNWRYNWVTNWELGSPITPESWVVGEILTKEEVETFNKFVPYGKKGIHTIESVKIVTIDEEMF